MKKTVIRNTQIVNEGKITTGDVLFHKGMIERIAPQIIEKGYVWEIDGEGKFLLPGLIDDQVHFREPGLTHKGNIYSESKAGVAGGVTSFMEMPNTIPTAVTNSLLEEKHYTASKNSLANYSFYLGTNNDNIEEIKKVDKKNICGIKIFMGSSTGNLVIDNQDSLENIFKYSPVIIATHCETDNIVRANTEKYKSIYGDAIPIEYHPIIRNEENCFISSKLAISLAKKYNSRLHILHISTSDEINLFDNSIPLEKKRITAEVCVHHLHFTADDYSRLGSQIKCNPAIKDKHHKPELLKALLDNHFDVIATDHAPHTWEEKNTLTADGKLNYSKAPAGLPLVQHGLNILLSMYHENKISLEKIVEKACHNVATCFDVKERGFIREGFRADLVLLDLHKKWTVSKDNIHYKCKWSPFEGTEFKGKVEEVFVNGNHVYHQGTFDEAVNGLRLEFNR